MIKGLSKFIMLDVSMLDFFEKASEAGYKCVELVIKKRWGTDTSLYERRYFENKRFVC